MNEFAQPSDDLMQGALAILEPWRRLTTPRFYDFDRVPWDGRMLLVGNHTLFGLLDAPLLWGAFWERRGRVLRSLGDHAHFRLPGWREVVTTFGVVDGTRDNCAALMQSEEPILVFPGGAREVTKKRDELYRLVWGERRGFARMALDHNCPIVPFGAVGMDDAYDIIVDPDEILDSPVGGILRKALGKRRDLVPPVMRGIGPTLLPRPERIYFGFGEPIFPESFDEEDEEAKVWALREATRKSIEERIAFLLLERERDPNRKFIPRLARYLTSKRR